MAIGMEQLIAQTILQGFDAQYGRFLEVTAGAQQRFEKANWGAVQLAMKKTYSPLRSPCGAGGGAATQDDGAFMS